MATSTTSTPSFNGSSTYASQLQQTITHAVAIASLPLTQLQSSQSTLNDQQSELNTLTSTFASLQSAISDLSTSTGTGAFTSSVSNTSVASASLSSGVMAGSYSINVLSTGSQTNAISQNGLPTVSDPSTGNVDTSSSYTLTVNGQTYSIADSAGTLNGLAQAINSSSASVQASVVNIGSASSPDYRLSIQSLTYAPDTIQLSDGSNDLLSTLSTGSNVTYQINGQPSTPISSDSRTVTVSPGLAVSLLQTGTSQVTVAQSATNLSNALSSFATAYNSVTAELVKNRGQNGGALSGDSLIYELQGQLENLVNFTGGSGGVQSLASLGLTFDDSGNLQFDQSAFNQAAATAPNDLVNFIGSATSGGFLEAANNMASAVTDSTTGVLAEASTNISSQLTTITSKISDQQSQISQLQATLTQQMANADSTISSLENQLTEMTDLFSQMQTNQRALSGE